MGWDKKLKYCKALSKSEYQDYVILANVLEGQNVKMTRECFEIIDECISKEIMVDKFLDGYEEDSKKYLIDLFDLLLDRYIVCEENSYAEKEINRLKQIDFLITSRCNLKCKHCCVDADCEYDEKELSTEQWKSIVDKIVGLEIDSVTISGGEPLMRSDLIEIAKYTNQKLNVKLQLMTNGTLITEENVDDLVNVFDSFSVSLDGADEESCSLIRGQGTFARAMKGIELLKSRGVDKLSISLTKVKQNEDKVDDFKKLAKRLGAFPMVRQFDIVGRAKEFPELIPSDYEKYFAPALNCEIPEGGHFHPDNMPKCTSCSAAHRKFCINSDGNMYPCMVLVLPGFELGNALEVESIKDYVLSGKIYESKGYGVFRGYHPVHSEKCKDCPAKLFCVSCIYQSYVMMNREDMCELCEKKREGLMAVWN